MFIRSSLLWQALCCWHLRFYGGISYQLYHQFQFPVTPLVPMGIVKIGHRGALKKSHDQQSSRSVTVNGLVQEERSLMGKDADDDFDDSDLADVGCELAMVGDQLCSIPYDLYNLPDLKDILSLETWNSCLTEEERFHLAAYLPDMDQETFVLTVNELFSGDSLFFGSPVDSLFRRLQGGFYSLQVTPVREGLRLLQKLGHYSSLRSYHESMTKRFVDMKKAWSSCLSSTTVEERVRIWNNRKDQQKPVLLVDLNAFPADEETLNKGDKKVEDFPLLKKTKYMDDGFKPHTPAIDLNSVAMNTKPKGKGVLKVRSMETNATSDHRMQSLPSDSWEPCKRVPKGVLKIRPKVDPLGQQERPVTIPILLGHTSAGILGIRASEFAPSLPASKWYEGNAGQKLKFLHQTDSGDNSKRRLEEPEALNDQQREELLNLGVGSFTNSRSFPRKIKTALNNRLHNYSELQEGPFSLKSNQRPRMQSKEGGIGSCHDGENLWQNLGQQSRVRCASSSDSDLFSPQNQQKLSPAHHIVPEETVRISTDCVFPQYLEHSEHRHNDRIDGGLSTTTDSTVVSGVGREIILPITYRRKKASSKFNPMESLRQPSLTEDIEPVVSNSADCTLIGKAKTVKIKVKRWNNHKAHYKQGLVNGLQHGSPSI